MPNVAKQTVVAQTVPPLNVSIPEAARILGSSRSRLYELARDKRLRMIKLQGRTLVPLRELERFQQELLKEAGIE